jgi:bifunctional non-homologous end joining protein LigD
MNRGAAKASFIEPMLLLRSGTLPEGPRWIYELKLDGYHLAIKSGGSVELRSRDNNDFTGKYPAIAKALNRPPDESVLDGEVVAFDESGRPSFNMLQNHRPGAAPVFYYVFDVLVFGGRNLTGEPLDVRRALLQTKVLPKLGEPIRHAAELRGSLHDLLPAVRAYGFEGLIAKRRDSLTSPDSDPVPGAKCASIGGRNSWSAVTRRVLGASMC